MCLKRNVNMHIGLDFGTTNSGAAVLYGQQVHVLPLDPWSFGPLGPQAC